MTIETSTYINTLNASLPGATDPESEGDDHIRLLKSNIKATFPNVTGAVTATHAELNATVGAGANTIATVAATANAAMPKAGGTMSGAIAMGTNKITGLANGSVSTDAAAFGQIPSTFVASGASHASGLVPDPGAVAGTTKFLREDATFAVPPSATPGGSSGNIQTNNGSGGFGSIAPGTNVSTALTNATNGASGLVQLDGSSRLPAVDGSQLTGITSPSYTLIGTITTTGVQDAALTTGTWTGFRRIVIEIDSMAISAGSIATAVHLTNDGGSTWSASAPAAFQTGTGAVRGVIFIDNTQSTIAGAAIISGPLLASPTTSSDKAGPFNGVRFHLASGTFSSMSARVYGIK